MVEHGGPNDASANNNDAIVRFHLLAPEPFAAHATEPFGARLDTHVQTGAIRSIFVDKCGFCRLVGERRICVCMAAALTAALGFARPKAASAAVSEDVVAWMNGSLGKRRQGRESGDGDRRDHLDSQDFPETRPEEWAIDRD